MISKQPVTPQELDSVTTTTLKTNSLYHSKSLLRTILATMALCCNDPFFFYLISCTSALFTHIGCASPDHCLFLGSEFLSVSMDLFSCSYVLCSYLPTWLLGTKSKEKVEFLCVIFLSLYLTCMVDDNKTGGCSFTSESVGALGCRTETLQSLAFYLI